jgi:SAM-dependent methyltransferase
MTTATAVEQQGYVLGRTRQEYERVRAQAQSWNRVTARLLEEVGVAPGAACLDAGCGPGETMRMMAERVGPAGRVLGLDVDGTMAGTTRAVLRSEGYQQCDVRIHDVTEDAPIPGGPFDLVYARLLLFHLPQRVAVLRRLWEAVAPGGRLLVQDYDLRGAHTVPDVRSVGELLRLLIEGMTAAGCDVTAGARLPLLFAQAGIGEPDGTDVSGYAEPLRTGRQIVERTFDSILPVALARGITTETDAQAALAALDDDASRFPDVPLVWPLLMGAWKTRTAGI